MVCLTLRVKGFYDGFAADRSLAELVNDYRSCVVADEERRLRLTIVVCLTLRVDGFYYGFAADRSLAELVNDYRVFARLLSRGTDHRPRTVAALSQHGLQ